MKDDTVAAFDHVPSDLLHVDLFMDLQRLYDQSEQGRRPCAHAIAIVAAQPLPRP